MQKSVAIPIICPSIFSLYVTVTRHKEFMAQEFQQMLSHRHE